MRALFDSLQIRLTDVINTAFSTDSQPELGQLLGACETLIQLVDSSAHLSGLDIRTILVGFGEIPSELVEFDRITLNNFDRVLNDGFIVDLVSKRSLTLVNEPECLLTSKYLKQFKLTNKSLIP